MKKFVAAALASALIVSGWQGVASAQSEGSAAAGGPPAECGTIAPRPSIPDGESATTQQMNEASATYSAWYTAATASLSCWQGQVEASRIEAQRITNSYNAYIANFNEFNNNWSAEVEVYCARPRTECQDPS